MNVRRQPSPKKSVELTLDESLLADVHLLGMDLAGAVEDSLRSVIKAEKARRWLEENRDAIEENNARIEREGLWSDGLRLF